MLEAEPTALLAAAQRAGTHDVDAALFAQLDRPSAYRVQIGVLAALQQTAGMLKTGIHSDGAGVVAPIYATAVGQADGFRLPAANVVGLEVEVGAVLAKALTGTVDEALARAAIDHYFVGVEICGSRYRDRKLAGLNAGLADNMSSLGYAIGSPRQTDDRIDGLIVRVEFGGAQLHLAPARHAFGTVLASLIAYANNQHPSYPLAAGTIVTTGSMCGLVPTAGTGHVVASLGDTTVEFDIV